LNRDLRLPIDGPMCFIPLTFDPKAVFGKVRAPVRVTPNGYTYRSTIAASGGPACIPLRRSNRDAAGVDGGETLEVRLDLDTDKREVRLPADFMKALKAAPPAWQWWHELSYSHQREYAEAIEEAKKPETRARRIEIAVRAIRASPERKRQQCVLRGLPQVGAHYRYDRLGSRTKPHSGHVLRLRTENNG